MQFLSLSLLQKKIVKTNAHKTNTENETEKKTNQESDVLWAQWTYTDWDLCKVTEMHAIIAMFILVLFFRLPRSFQWKFIVTSCY